MTEQEIAALKASAQAATPGPWQWWTSNSQLRLTGADGKDGGVLHGTAHRGYGDVSCSEADRVFIAAANPAAILELIALLDAMRQNAAAAVELLAALVERVRNLDDCGPFGDGWQSDELSKAIADADELVARHRTN